MTIINPEELPEVDAQEAEKVELTPVLPKSEISEYKYGIHRGYVEVIKGDETVNTRITHHESKDRPITITRPNTADSRVYPQSDIVGFLALRAAQESKKA